MFARDYRARAREALRGRWKRMTWLTFLAMLLGAGTVGGTSSVGVSSSDFEGMFEGQIPPEMWAVLAVLSVVLMCISLWFFFMGSFVRVGYTGMLSRAVDGETPRAGMLFPRGIYWKSIGLAFMKGLYIALWSMLLVIPGIIAAYRYAMADYILYQNPEMGVMDALRESKQRMVGRKWRMFCLEISFIGWQMLALVPAWLLLIGGGVYVGFSTAVTAESIGVIAGPSMMQMGAMWIAILIGGLLSAIASLFVQTYMNTAVVAFFKDADRAGTWREEARAGEEYAEAAYGGHAEPTIATAMPHLGDNAPVESVLTADETVARDVFIQHKCSRSLLEKAGLLEEYLKLKPSPIAEARWRKDYGDNLMRRFDADPSVLDDLLTLAAEYAMDDLTNRALQRIERHLRQETLENTEILNMCGRVLALLVSGCFAENPGFIQRKKEQISDMIDRLQVRLQAEDPDGAWQQDLALIRRMCA